jgi:hypothetical protein
MSAPRCATCKHWHKFTEGHDDLQYSAIGKNRLGMCGKIPDVTDIGGQKYAKPPIEAPDVQAATEDLSGCSALRTRADFGCVLWEVRL